MTNDITQTSFPGANSSRGSVARSDGGAQQVPVSRGSSGGNAQASPPVPTDVVELSDGAQQALPRKAGEGVEVPIKVDDVARPLGDSRVSLFKVNGTQVTRYYNFVDGSTEYYPADLPQDTLNVPEIDINVD